MSLDENYLKQFLKLIYDSKKPFIELDYLESNTVDVSDSKFQECYQHALVKNYIKNLRGGNGYTLGASGDFSWKSPHIALTEEGKLYLNPPKAPSFYDLYKKSFKEKAIDKLASITIFAIGAIVGFSLNTLSAWLLPDKNQNIQHTYQEQIQKLKEPENPTKQNYPNNMPPQPSNVLSK